MNRLILGHNSTGKTTHIKKLLNEIDGKKIILDYRDAYDDVTDNVFYLDAINPLFDELSLDDVKALNAGYIHDSHCLHRNAKHLFNEYKTTKYKGVIEETIMRMFASWDEIDNQYADLLSKKIPSKVSKNHLSLDESIDEIMKEDTILLKTKNMHSDHTRAITYLLFSRISSQYTEKVTIIADDLSKTFNTGNLKLMMSTLGDNKLDFVFSFNKVTNLSKNIISMIDEVTLFRFENINEHKKLIELNLVHDVPKNIKQFKNGKYITLENKKQVLINS